MNNNYRYVLERYSGKNSRYECPECGVKNEFTRYIDTQTDEHIAENVGKCNRADKCGYHYRPRQYFKNTGIKPSFNKTKIRHTPIQPIPPSFIDDKLFYKSLRDYENNRFVQYLISKFGEEKTKEQIVRYSIGTSKHWCGATVFWQQDLNRKIKAGKIMLYNPTTGKRVKEPHNHITWVHAVLKLPKFNLKQCLFGEHLLNGNNSLVAIVESEKTAIIASMYMPQYIWIATGSKDGLSFEKCGVLAGRKGVLFPDLNGYDKWQSKAIKIPYLSGFSVSHLLEEKATDQEKERGLDLADYLQRFQTSQFTKEPI